jgi:DNA polymerase III epsilon subunit-like protein
VQYAYIVIRGDGTVVRKVLLLSVRPSNVDTPLRVTKLTVEELRAGRPLRECRDEMEVAFCRSGTPVGWSFANDVTITNNNLRAEGMEPLLGNGICALAFAKKIFRYTSRTTKNFEQKEIGIALGITDAMLEDHIADDDAVLGARIFAKLLHIADKELGVVTEDQLTNLLDHDALPSLQHSSRNADKKRSASSHEDKDPDFQECQRHKKGRKSSDKGPTEQPIAEDGEAQARHLAAKIKASIAAKEDKKRRDLAETQRQEHQRELLRTAIRGAEKLDPKDASKWLADMQKRVDDKKQAYVADIMGSDKGSGRLLFVRGTHRPHICAVS